MKVSITLPQKSCTPLSQRPPRKISLCIPIAIQAIADPARPHLTVKHRAHEFARDADGDGINEVHDNTIAGIWPGLQNFLRPFRGLHQKFRAQYIAMFEWLYNLEQVTAKFLRMLLVPDFTYLPT